MDEWVDRLEHLTQSIVERLDSAGYDELAEFAEQRAAVIAKMQEREWSKADRERYGERIRRILQHDRAILAALNRQKDEAARQLIKLQNAERQKNAYQDAGARGYPPDSMFFDRRS
jgi:DNA-binding ferritin-like protein